MNNHLGRIASDNEDYVKNVKVYSGVKRAATVANGAPSSRKMKTNHFRSSSLLRNTTSKSLISINTSGFPHVVVTWRVIQVALMVSFVFLLSYAGIYHGQREYSLLENGQIAYDRSIAYKPVITLSVGYSFEYSLISCTAACMLLYSLWMGSPRWSLPLIILYLADMVCDIGDALVAIRLFFGSFPALTALYYTTGTVLLILLEAWAWFGVLRLYEERQFALTK